MMQLGTQQIGIWRDGPPTEDKYHNEIPGKPARVATIGGCSVQPVSAVNDYLNARSSTTVDYTVFAPIKADIRNTDRVEFPVGSGDMFDINGAVMRWEIGTTLDHLVINLALVQG